MVVINLDVCLMGMYIFINMMVCGIFLFVGYKLQRQVLELMKTYQQATATSNLFSQSTETPLVYLTGRQKIQGSGDVFQLKAHISALKGSNDPGPYTLQTILINRIPDNRTESPARGNASGLSFTIGKHEFSEYDDEAYEPSATEKQRLNLLQSIGSEN